MHSRRTWLLTCAALFGCFNPTGSADTSGLPTTGQTSASSASSGDGHTSTTSAASTDAMLSTSTDTTGATTISTTGTSGGACGDGHLDEGEECDGGAQCSDSCTKEFRRVFVTSKVFTGDLGGLAGADEKCQEAAVQAGLPGIYRAWLSTPASSSANLLLHSSVPYRDLNDIEIASNWADLVDGTLKNGIYVSELGGPPGVGVHSCLENSRPVWTNTQSDASTYTPDMHCENWDGAGVGFAGLAGDINSLWTVGCMANCGEEAALYCFEQ